MITIHAVKKANLWSLLTSIRFRSRNAPIPRAPRLRTFIRTGESRLYESPLNTPTVLQCTYCFVCIHTINTTSALLIRQLLGFRNRRLFKGCLKIQEWGEIEIDWKIPEVWSARGGPKTAVQYYMESGRSVCRLTAGWKLFIKFSHL